MVLKSKLIGSYVQSDINLTQSDLHLDWNWVYQKRGWFFARSRILSCLPPQGRLIHGQDGPGTSLGEDRVTNREVEIWTRVALWCSVAWHWQWRRHQDQVGSGNGHGRTLGLLLVSLFPGCSTITEWFIWFLQQCHNAALFTFFNAVLC